MSDENGSHRPHARDPRAEGADFFGEVTWEQTPGALIAFKGDAVFLAPDPAAGEEESAGGWDESGWTEIGSIKG